MAATKFGRLAAHDPRFVLDLRMGRIPRPETEARTRAWMRNFEASLEQVKSSRITSAMPAPMQVKGAFHAA
ncbi:hypothetical protein [Erythrobacter sp.]|uniref:hypothetical protein n=1 Tax=Erythrobacter sp. TaxID=1042 RepID=UPI002EC2E716|nr:hypothetical protein [Erythrobacter sp.]